MNISYLSSVSNFVLSSKPSTTIRLLSMVLFVSITPMISFGQSQTFSTSGTFNVPAGVTSITVEAWGAGGGGKNGGGGGADGGGGGGYAKSTFSVTPGFTYDYIVGAGGSADNNGKNSSFGSTLLVASGGKSDGSGGTANTGATTFDGGNGGINSKNKHKGGAGGGSAAGIDIKGNPGSNAANSAGSNGGAATSGGGKGGKGGKDGEKGLDGDSPGGGGGGGGKQYNGGAGGNGQIIITYAPSTPLVGTPKQPDCKTTTGSVVLSGLPEGNWTINPGGIAGNTSSVIVSNLAAGSYNFTVSIGNYASAATADVIINAAETNTWTTKWSLGTPNKSQKLVFTGIYPPTVDPNVDITGCSCMITGGAEVIIRSGKTLTITNELTVVGGGKLTFENSASLIQTNDVKNSGNIIYRRVASSPITSNYTYWSSPVASQTLDLSPYYKLGNFYSFDNSTETWTPATIATTMLVGQGYIAKGPVLKQIGLFTATFIGEPNNGPQSVSVPGGGKSILLGNPYPSAIDADAFLSANSTAIDGTLYFWTHNTALQDRTLILSTAGSGALAYTSNDYAVYNLTGGVIIDGVTYAKGGTVASIGGVKPSGKIAAGQSFFTTSTAAGGLVNFTNAMRVNGLGKALDNSNFFKTKSPSTKTASTIEKHRVWLDLSNNQGAFKQTLIGYVTDATNDYDSRFDGESFDGQEFVDFYSINQDKNLVIQGRALPFDENDEVPLGYRTTINGAFTINIDEADGLMTKQVVYLEDKLTNTVFDLKAGNYTFNTEAGTFNDRFVLRYVNTNKTLGNNTFDSLENKVVVSNANKQIKINSFAETIDSVVIYDILGRQIYQKDKVNSNELSISNLLSSHQTVIVKTLLQNGKTFTDKIIF